MTDQYKITLIVDSLKGLDKLKELLTKDFELEIPKTKIPKAKTAK